MASVRALVATIVMAVLAGVGAADPIVDEATRLQAALDYDGALAVVERALAAGGATRDDYAARQLLAGELAAGLDRGDVARDHYAHALAVQPELRLPEGTSPKLVLPFEAARMRGAELRVHAVRDGDEIALVVDADPLALIAGIAVGVADASGAQLIARHALRVIVPAAQPIGDVTALDDAGNAVWGGAATVIAKPVPAVTPPRRGVWWPFAAAAGVAAATAGVAAWQVSVAQSDWNALRADNGHHDYSELVAVEHRGEAWAITANAAFVVTGVAVIITVVQALRHPEHVRAGGVGVAGRF
jgi:hypothetical protein